MNRTEVLVLPPHRYAFIVNQIRAFCESISFHIKKQGHRTYVPKSHIAGDVLCRQISTSDEWSVCLCCVFVVWRVAFDLLLIAHCAETLLKVSSDFVQSRFFSFQSL